MEETSKIVYQRQVPILLASVLAGIVIANNFAVPYPPLRSLNSFCLDLTAVVMSFVTLFGWLSMLSGHVRRVVRRGGERRMLLKSAVILVTIICFGILGLSDPKGTSGANWSWLFGELVMMIPMSFRWLAHLYVPLVAFRIRSLGGAIMLVTWLLGSMREAPMFAYAFPWINPVMDWVMKGVTTTVMRACMMAAAVGGVILCARALVGKEPGLIEAEVS